MVGVVFGAVVDGCLIGPVHTAFIASFQTPAIVEGAQPVEFDIECLMAVFGFAFPQEVIVPNCVAEVLLFLLSVALNMPRAEGGVGGEFFARMTEFLCV